MGRQSLPDRLVCVPGCVDRRVRWRVSHTWPEGERIGPDDRQSRLGKAAGKTASRLQTRGDEGCNPLIRQIVCARFSDPGRGLV
jgi:hypothetical protein